MTDKYDSKDVQWMRIAVASGPIDASEAGHGMLMHVGVNDVKDAELICHRGPFENAADVLVKKMGGRYLFRLIYPRCDWVRSEDLPRDYAEIAKTWLKLRRRGAL